MGIVPFYSKEDIKMKKMKTLRMVMIAVLTLAWVGTFFVKKRYHLPVRWLLHYLIGTGKPMRVPERLLQPAASALNEAIRADLYNDADAFDTNGKGRFCVYSSILYDGYGFSERPSLFYLLGGFTFKMYNASWLPDGWVLVSGNDTYDWHPNKQGFYFDSPLGNNVLVVKVVKFLERVFGNEYFHEGDPESCNRDNVCISNKLWCDMKEYGAKEFVSYFNNVVVDLREDYDDDEDYEDDYDDEDYD